APLFTLVVGAASAVAVDEFLSLADKKGIGRPGRWFAVMAALVTMSFDGGGTSLPMTLAVTTIVLMTATIFTPPIDTALGRIGMGLGAIGYCALTLGFLVILPRDLFLVLLAIIWVGDAAAFYGGRTLGRHLLAPKISPKKTVEGAIAGLLGSIVAGVIGAVWY